LMDGWFNGMHEQYQAASKGCIEHRKACRSN
jgi:hypothetical protein